MRNLAENLCILACSCFESAMEKWTLLQRPRRVCS